MKKPEEGEELIQKVLQLATEESSNPDLKDRAYIYWRMLSTSPQKTHDVVLCTRPQIAADTYNIYDSEFVDQLIDQISNATSIYHKTEEEWKQNMAKYERKELPPVEKVPVREPEPRAEKKDDKQKQPKEKQKKKKQKQKDSDSEEKKKEKPKKKEVVKKQTSESKPEETKQTPPPLLDMDDLLSTPNQPQQPQGFGFDNDTADAGGDDWAKMDLFGGGESAPNDFAAGTLREVMSSITPGKAGTTGLSVKGHFFLKNTVLTLGLEVTNNSGSIHNDFDLKFKRNPFGVHVEGATKKIQIAAPGSSSYGTVDCCIDK